MNSLVSVVIPTYNRASMLKEAIESVLVQTYQDWELIVVDDGSTDKTPAIVASYRGSCRSISYIRQPQQGQFAALNTGLSRTRGEFIAPLDDDDAWLPDKLETQVAYLERYPEISLVYCPMIVMDSTGQTGTRKPSNRWQDTFQELLRHNFIPMTVMVRRTCFDEVGVFDASLSRSGDYDMWLRIACGYRFESIQEPLALFRWHSKNKTTHVNALHYACHVRIFQKLSENPDLPAKYRMLVKHRLARELYLLGKASLLENRVVEACRGFRQALMANPLIGLAFADEADRLDQRIWKAMKPYLAVGYTWLRGFSV